MAGGRAGGRSGVARALPLDRRYHLRELLLSSRLQVPRALDGVIGICSWGPRTDEAVGPATHPAGTQPDHPRRASSVRIPRPWSGRKYVADQRRVSRRNPPARIGGLRSAPDSCGAEPEANGSSGPGGRPRRGHGELATWQWSVPAGCGPEPARAAGARRRQRRGAFNRRLNRTADPEFAAALRSGAAAGVGVKALCCRVSPRGVWLDRGIPIRLDKARPGDKADERY